MSFQNDWDFYKVYAMPELITLLDQEFLNEPVTLYTLAYASFYWEMVYSGDFCLDPFKV